MLKLLVGLTSLGLTLLLVSAAVATASPGSSILKTLSERHVGLHLVDTGKRGISVGDRVDTTGSDERETFTLDLSR